MYQIILKYVNVFSIGGSRGGGGGWGAVGPDPPSDKSQKYRVS